MECPSSICTGARTAPVVLSIPVLGSGDLEWGSGIKGTFSSGNFCGMSDIGAHSRFLLLSCVSHLLATVHFPLSMHCGSQMCMQRILGQVYSPAWSVLDY